MHGLFSGTFFKPEIFGRLRTHGKAHTGRYGGIMAKAVTDNEFEKEVLNSPIPVLVDFWAPWCGPCRAVGPVVEELGKEYEGRVAVVKMNVDDNPAAAGNYNIRSIPTLILFKNGQVAEQVVGAVSKNSLKDLIEQKGLA
jgi:thioredoxin 1